MTENSPSVSERLASTMLAVFPGYVRERVARLEMVDGDSVDAVVDAAAARLEEQLAGWDKVSLSESPLEMMRIATEPVTAALERMGVAPVTRDARTEELHPDDVYDLYPATSRDLGEDLWRVHMEWGVERARLVAGMVPVESETSRAVVVPSVGLFGFHEEQRSTIAEAVTAAGYRALLWRNPAALDSGLAVSPVLVIVDLAHPAAEAAIRQAADAARVVAIGKGIDDFTETATMALGAEEVVDSDRILDRLGALLPRLV